MTSLLKRIDYKSGIIKFIENELILEDFVIGQLVLLREDLLQVEYGFGRYILDVGWYPSFQENGAFHILIVKDKNWTTPIYRAQTIKLVNLQKAIQDAVDVLEEKQFE